MTTFSPAILGANTTSALSFSFAFNGSGQGFHVIVNAGNTNYVRRADVIRIYPYEREFV